MNLILLHGNGLTAISNKISAIKKDFDPMSVVQISGKETNFEQTLLELSTPNLFAQERLIVLEDLDDKLDLNRLPTDEKLTVILKFSKNLASKSVLLKAAQSLKAQIINLTEIDEASIFPFLDLLADKNPKAIEQMDFRLAEHGGQYILTMIFYLLRRMVQPMNKLPLFVAKKIESQKQNFPLEKIDELYKTTLETDFKIKSGLIEEKLGMTLLIDKILTI